MKAARLSNFQIFNRRDDIGESQGLSQSHPDKLVELKMRLETFYNELVQGSHDWEAAE